MKKIIFSLIIITFLSSILLLFGEILIRSFYPNFANYNMEMWRYAAEIKKPLDYANLPFHHYPNKRGTFYGVEIKTNSLGFRDNDYNQEKTDSKKRILFLGDSFTLGWGVPFDNIFSKELEKTLNKNTTAYEVINMGIGNYNTIMEVELFKLKGQALKPDMVILMYFINDAEPVPAKVSMLEYRIRKYSYFFAFIFDRYIRFKTIFDQSFDWNQYYSNLYSENSDSLAANRRAFIELIELCNKNNVKLLVVNIPELHDLTKYPFPFVTQYIENIALSKSVPFLDLLPSLKHHEPESLWVSLEDPHANAKANSIISHAIYNKIMSEGLLN